MSSSLLTSRRQCRQGTSRHQAAREQRYGVDEADAARKPANPNGGDNQQDDGAMLWHVP
jgi:hypothetical protein